MAGGQPSAETLMQPVAGGVEADPVAAEIIAGRPRPTIAIATATVNEANNPMLELTCATTENEIASGISATPTTMAATTSVLHTNGERHHGRSGTPGVLTDNNDIRLHLVLRLQATGNPSRGSICCAADASLCPCASKPLIPRATAATTHTLTQRQSYCVPDEPPNPRREVRRPGLLVCRQRSQPLIASARNHVRVGAGAEARRATTRGDRRLRRRSIAEIHGAAAGS